MSPSATSRVELSGMVAGELTDLAEVLANFAPEQWDSPTLCAGWRVREVIAHMTMPTRSSPFWFFAEIVRDRGNINRMANRIAVRDAGLPAAALVSAMASEDLRRWSPPGGGTKGALVHAVIHGLDVTEALGVERTVPPARLRVVLAELVSPASAKFFKLDLDGLRLEATDLEWSAGSGDVVAATAQDLALALSGRRLPPGSLTGDGAGRLSGPST
ncbi:MAG TPA: maleylpyruvate isomerase family mycothiol-dependent enzyme [Acidimicrobiales bacterium]